MKLVKGLALSAVASSLVLAGGYKLPENSINSTALSAAYVAHTMGADTAYFNPANMAFMEDKHFVEGALTLVRLPYNEYTLMDPYSGESTTENILVPSGHYVSSAMGDFRWGVSLVAPGGLTKRWETPVQKLFAEEFTLKIVELNPSFSYKVNDQFAIGGGLRAVYSEGVVKSDGADASAIPGFEGYNLKRNMEGDTVEFGYNLALAYRPTSDINVAVTYRSKVDLQEEGTAQLYYSGAKVYDGDSCVTVPLPAALNVAISKTWEDKFTLEFNYERTYWSAYEDLDFNYATALPSPELTYFFDTPKAKDWKDTNTFRVGATMELNEKLTAMMGFAIDESPAPLKTLGFELPDSDAKIFSMGFRVQQSEQLSWGASFLYDSKDPISMPAGISDNPVLANGGSFNEGGAFLTTVGIAYEY